MLLHNLFQHFGCERLRALNRPTQCPRPNVISRYAQGATHTKQYSVEVKFANTVIILQRAANSIHIRGGILGFALLPQHLRNYVENHICEAEKLIFGEALLGKLHLSHVTRVRYTQNGMTIAGNDLPTVQRIPGEFVQLFARRNAAELILPIDQPDQAFLIGPSVQRTGKPIDRCCELILRGRKGRTDQVHSMR